MLLKDVARVTIGPELRRGLAEWNGEGETVGGIVVVRAGADTRGTIERVKERLAELEAGLPDDVEISTAYDRSGLIERSIDTLTDTLLEELIVVSLVCILFLFHFRSAFVAIVSIPLSILLAFVVMRVCRGWGPTSCRSAGSRSRSACWSTPRSSWWRTRTSTTSEWKSGVGEAEERSHFDVILRSAQEVGPTLFFTLLVITVSFMPVFTLQAQEGRLFKPLAYTKTYAMGMAAILAVTVVPVLMYWFVRGRIRGEERHPVSRLLRFLYRPVLRFAVRWRWFVIVATIVALAITVVPLSRIGSEFMPPLWEGDLLYMPTTFPGLSITKARRSCSRPTRSCAPSRRSSRSSARSGAPRRRPIRRRSR